MTPVLGVGGVVVRDGKAVIVKRANDPHRGEWSIPGGRVEAGETLADAVRREMKEETGLDITVGPVIEIFERIERQAGQVLYHFVVIDYLCTCTGGALCAGDDAEDAAWVSSTELANYPIADGAVAVIRKALRLQQAPDGHRGDNFSI